MTTVTDLNAYRSKRWVRQATDSGWDVDMQGAGEEPMAAVWIYSARLDGTIRAAGQLLQSAIACLDHGKCEGLRKKDLDIAATAIELLIEKPNDSEAHRLALTALTDYFSRTKTWQLAGDGRLPGRHMIVVDWPHPEDEHGFILRPAMAVQPRMLSTAEVRHAVFTVLQVERAKHPERLPKNLR